MFIFHTATTVIATFETIEEAATFAEAKYAMSGEGVAVTLPQGGELNARMFIVHAQQVARAKARFAAVAA